MPVFSSLLTEKQPSFNIKYNKITCESKQISVSEPNNDRISDETNLLYFSSRSLMLLKF